jgi:hypothetical protein
MCERPRSRLFSIPKSLISHPEFHPTILKHLRRSPCRKSDISSFSIRSAKAIIYVPFGAPAIPQDGRNVLISDTSDPKFSEATWGEALPLRNLMNRIIQSGPILRHLQLNILHVVEKRHYRQGVPLRHEHLNMDKLKFHSSMTFI